MELLVATPDLLDLDVGLFVVAPTIVHVDLTVDGVSFEGIGVFLHVNVVVVVTTAPPGSFVVSPASPWASSWTSWVSSSRFDATPGSGEIDHHKGQKEDHKS